VRARAASIQHSRIKPMHGMHVVRRWAAFGAGALAYALVSGCTTTGVLVTLAGVATDTSMTWTVVKYVHGQLTEGDERPCVLLNSVQRALSLRCGAFVPGSLAAADVERTGLAECSLTLAARDPRLWPVLGELLDKGARTSTCAEPPLAQLARAHPCPEFGAAAPAARAALARLAISERRARSSTTSCAC
jgi:hypothetical protein